MLLLLLSLLAAHRCSSGQQVPTVQTSMGAVRGFHVDYGDDVTQLYSGAADVFLGIPYAIPPLGELRFRLPRKICSYGAAGINATAYGPGCPQAPNEQLDHADEDCLQLNVMSPSVTSGKKYPVMVWIHGGTYVAGSAYHYDYKGGVRNFVSKGVVLVVIQYRIDVLGFFTTVSEEFPANRGIFDQLLALRWVQKEIGAFGGDASQVTIFGESAGACAVSALALSPLSKVIQQSGGELLLHLTMDSPIPTLDKYIAKEPKTVHHMSVYADGFLFPDTLARLAQQRPNYPTMLGNVLSEVLIVFTDILPDAPGAPADLSTFNSSIFENFIALNFPYLEDKKHLLSDILTRVYKRERDISDSDNLEWFKLAVEALSDLMFTSALRFDATYYAANGNPHLFLYTYDYMSVFGGNVTYGGWRAVPHGSELQFLWKFKSHWESKELSGSITEDDKAIADFLSDTWTSFAIKGKPSPDWPAVSSLEQMEYYRIVAPRGHVESQYAQNAHDVYNSIFQSLVGEFPPQNNGPQARKWLDEHYLPKIRAEYERSMKC